MPNHTTRITDALTARGLTLPTPTSTPEAPTDVTLLDPDTLGRLMTQYAALIAYIASEEATATARAKTLAARYRHERAVRYLERKAALNKTTEKHIDALLDADPTLHELREHELGADAYARLLRALQQGHETTYAVLSREITRRTLRTDNTIN